MRQRVNLFMSVGCVACAVGLIGLTGYLASCSTAPQPFIVRGPGTSGTEPPTLLIIEPNANITADQGSNFVIRWTDSDPDSNAKISFSIVNTISNTTFPLVDDLDENDTVGPDQFTVNTSLLPVGTYNLVGTIDDSDNPAVTIFAMTTAASVEQRAIITIVEPGQVPSTSPPNVAVTAPMFNQSVAQDDILRITVQPTLIAGDMTPFDADGPVTLFVLLDFDQNPNNDDPANPVAGEIIVLREQAVAANAFAPIQFEIPIDLAVIPPRTDGQPYFIRATADDFNNPRVHQYAVGTISVASLAAGSVDLFDIGKTISGTRFYGFNPGANLGSSMSSIMDFDLDGVDDFILVAQFGNPRNFGLIGEAYVIYGQDQVRFGSSIGVNSVAETIPGVLFEAPPIRSGQIPASDARTDGITDVNFLPDMTGDGRPEIIIGMAHVHGAFDSTDYDPSDTDLSQNTGTTVTVTVTVREGRAESTSGMDPPVTNASFRGVDDTSISSAFPTTILGSEGDLSWQDAGAGQRQWALIKFRNVLEQIPDSPANIDFETLNANLQVRVFRQGGQGAIHQALTDFTEQTTYASYAKVAGDPVGGPGGSATADYVIETNGGGLANIDGTMAASTTADVGDLVRLLLDGELLESANNELRFIVVPSATDGAQEASIRSSEFGTDASRPELTISYQRLNSGASLGCYPDTIVNNSSDTPDGIRDDTQFYAGGMAVIVNGSNRDNDGLINQNRLESSVVTLELAGMRGLTLGEDELSDRGTGGLFPRVDNGNQATATPPFANEAAQPGRIAGARLTAGGFDFVDASVLRQSPREGLFGQSVSSIGDLNNDGVNEIIVSAPNNERYLADLQSTFGFASTHLVSTIYRGSITVMPGSDYNTNINRDKASGTDGTAIVPVLDQQRFPPFGRCTNPSQPRHYVSPTDAFEIFAEDIDDFLGDGQSAGDFNQDGLEDILCGAPNNDRTAVLLDTGSTYIIYGRNVLGDFDLSLANDSLRRPPMLRIRGNNIGDQIGTVQSTGLDVNGDRIDDVFLGSPTTDFGGIRRNNCGGDFNGNGSVDGNDFSVGTFLNCKALTGTDVFSDDQCKVFDYNNDEVIDDADRIVLDCLRGGGTDCCANLVDNGFVAVIFGGVFVDGDRTLNQIATSDLPGTIFFGSAFGHRAGADVSSAGDFNQDGFGDLLVTAPGEIRVDDEGRERLGVVYLIFGGPHLENTRWNLNQVGTEDLPGIVFISPYTAGRPNEAAPQAVELLGDINNDGFDDIGIGNPKADFIDLNFPQGPDATDASVGRRRNAGDVYIIYGNNFGENRNLP